MFIHVCLIFGILFKTRFIVDICISIVLHMTLNCYRLKTGRRSISKAHWRNFCWFCCMLSGINCLR